MSASNYRLPLSQAAKLAAAIADDLWPVCERVEVAGSVRRGCADVGDIELVAIPKFSVSLFPDVPGVSLLDMHLVALMGRGRLARATDTPIEKLTEKEFYIGSLLAAGYWFKVTINVTDAETWPVILAIKTGPESFVEKLRTYHKYGGWLPGHWEIEDGWKFWERNGAGERCWVTFRDEREFIETFCGAWIEPEKR